MGLLEKESKKRRRKGEIQKALLGAIGVSGLLLVAMAAPNALQLLTKLPHNKYRFNNQAKTALSRLKSRGLIRFTNEGGKHYAEITSAGRRELMRSEGRMAQHVARKKWDKRWRIVMFDIPERRRKARDQLRARMRSLGFFRLQDSAWTYPHDCEDVIALLKTELHLGSAVLYLIADIDNDRKLREEFGLS